MKYMTKDTFSVWTSPPIWLFQHICRATGYHSDKRTSRDYGDAQSVTPLEDCFLFSPVLNAPNRDAAFRRYPALLDLIFVGGIVGDKEMLRDRALEQVFSQIHTRALPAEVCPTLVALMDARPDALSSRMNELFILHPEKIHPLPT